MSGDEAGLSHCTNKRPDGIVVHLLPGWDQGKSWILLRTKMTAHAKPKRDNSLLDIACENPMQIVAKIRQYFSLHAQDLIDLGDLPSQLGISKQCLEVSVEQVRGMSLAQALQEHRLNRLFAALTDHPRQGPGHAITGLWVESYSRCCCVI